MKISWLVGLVGVLAIASLANAALVATDVYAEDPAKVTLKNQVWQELPAEGDVSTGSLTLYEKLHDDPAAVNGGFTCIGDPRVWVNKNVENDMGFSWAAYHIDIAMSQPFSIIDVSAPTLNGYAWAFMDAPVTLQDGKWVGSVDYWAENNNLIAPGDFADFGIRVEFDGSVQFCVTQTAIAPEPVSLMLLAAGSLLLARRKV